MTSVDKKIKSIWSSKNLTFFTLFFKFIFFNRHHVLMITKCKLSAADVEQNDKQHVWFWDQTRFVQQHEQPVNIQASSILRPVISWTMAHH